MASSLLHRPRSGAEHPHRRGLRGGLPPLTREARAAGLALFGILLVALGLRLWGIGSGLPFVYNSDEEAHFVPIAVGFFGHSLDPRYFLNPPGFTELLYVIYAVWFGGRDAIGAGISPGTKYTAGIALVPLLSAIAVLAWEDGRVRVGWALRSAAIGIAATVVGFLIANPYALLDFSAFHGGISQQKELTGGGNLEKLGLTQRNGIVYYLWSLTWGLGWIPAFAALGGAVRLAVADRRLALVLLPTPVIYVLYMGTQDRYFGRWILPVLPIVIVLAAYFGVWVARELARRWPVIGPLAGVLVAALLVAQGFVTSVHDDVVNARQDTRNTVRDWMLAHVPAGSRVVIEPVVPAAWYLDPDTANPAVANGDRWNLWDTTRADVDDQGRPLPHGQTRYVRVDRYERTLRPQLIDEYVERGYCWIVTASQQRDRALAQPGQAPQAVAYYGALAQRGTAMFTATPYKQGAKTPPFNFDWSFDYYPFAYTRPGPQMTVYRLHGGACG